VVQLIKNAYNVSLSAGRPLGWSRPNGQQPSPPLQSAEGWEGESPALWGPSGILRGSGQLCVLSLMAPACAIQTPPRHSLKHELQALLPRGSSLLVTREKWEMDG
jgi:hypothetical protein